MIRGLVAFLWFVALLLATAMLLICTAQRAHGQFAGQMSAEELAKYEARRIAGRDHVYVVPFVDPRPGDTRQRCYCIRQRANYAELAGNVVCHQMQILGRYGDTYLVPYDQNRIGGAVWMHIHDRDSAGGGNPIGGAIVEQIPLAGEIESATRRRRVVTHSRVRMAKE